MHNNYLIRCKTLVYKIYNQFKSFKKKTKKNIIDKKIWLGKSKNLRFTELEFRNKWVSKANLHSEDRNKRDEQETAQDGRLIFIHPQYNS